MLPIQGGVQIEALPGVPMLLLGTLYAGLLATGLLATGLSADVGLGTEAALLGACGRGDVAAFDRLPLVTMGLFKRKPCVLVRRRCLLEALRAPHRQMVRRLMCFYQPIDEAVLAAAVAPMDPDVLAAVLGKGRWPQAFKDRLLGLGIAQVCAAGARPWLAEDMLVELFRWAGLHRLAVVRGALAAHGDHLTVLVGFRALRRFLDKPQLLSVCEHVLTAAKAAGNQSVAFAVTAWLGRLDGTVAALAAEYAGVAGLPAALQTTGHRAACFTVCAIRAGHPALARLVLAAVPALADVGLLLEIGSVFGVLPETLEAGLGAWTAHGAAVGFLAGGPVLHSLPEYCRLAWLPGAPLPELSLGRLGLGPLAAMLLGGDMRWYMLLRQAFAKERTIIRGVHAVLALDHRVVLGWVLTHACGGARL